MAEDLRLYCDFFQHPKTQLLRRRLGSDGVLALLQLWCAAATSYPDGNLAGKSDEFIEIIAGWNGPPGVFLPALVELAFLDGSQDSYQIHNWAAHQPYVTGRETRCGKARKAAEARWHREARAEEGAAMRARRLEIARGKGVHSEQEWQELVRICGRVCARCKQDRKLEKDHVHSICREEDPLASDAIGNLQPLCEPCNKGKGTDDTKDYRPPAWERLLRTVVPQEAGEQCSKHAPSMPRAMPPSLPTQPDKTQTATNAPPGSVEPQPVEPQPQAEGEAERAAREAEDEQGRQEFLAALRRVAEGKGMERAGPAVGQKTRAAGTLQAWRA